MDAGFRIPRGLFTFNFADWGNFHQCLGIEEVIPNSVVRGKYCSIRVPLFQNQQQFSASVEIDELLELLDEETQIKILEFYHVRKEMSRNTGNADLSESESPSLALSLAVCIPEVCTTRQVIDYRLQGLPFTNIIEFDELFCRLPDDKPFSAGDFVAITILSLFGLLIICSTIYELSHIFIFKKDPKQMNKLCVSFSVYTNTRRLITFRKSEDNLDCIDGIRSFAIVWIIIGHTFSISLSNIGNLSDTLDWIQDFRSVWLLASPISVDTFFLMSGLLLVYTSVAKYNRRQFLKNIPLFYLLRYIRIFPLLATAVMLQATLFNHVSDGPSWTNNAVQIESCRKFWWATLLHVQNYVNPLQPCIGILWYLSVDMQLYWISPLVVFWVLSKSRRMGWIALNLGLVISLTIGAVISFLSNLASTPVSLSRPDELDLYMTRYYVNTLTRASPFFVGMIYGYILHICKGSKAVLPPIISSLSWALAIAASSFVFFISQPIGREDYDNQLLDNFLNSFKRPLWAAAVGWLIFACVHGYAGPVNWFLSLSVWKLPARLSFAMYVFHYPLMFIYQGSLMSPLFFTVGNVIYRFCSDLVLTFAASFMLTIAIESPIFNIRKLIIKER